MSFVNPDSCVAFGPVINLISFLDLIILRLDILAMCLKNSKNNDSLIVLTLVGTFLVSSLFSLISFHFMTKYNVT